MHRAISVLIGIFLHSGALLAPPVSFAQQRTQSENWCTEAEKNLTTKDGKPISCNEVARRCIQMNNYWCQKHGSSPWRGTTDKNGRDGNRDIDGHAVFESVDWSARAIAIDLRAKYRRGLVSAVQIGAAYSPWCDTLGSKAIVNGSGRNCKDGRATPPPSFSGPFCKQPKSMPLSKANCLPGCNCPPNIAEVLVRGLQTDINEDLKLFDLKGSPLPNLAVVIRNLAIQEQGVYIKQETIAAGIALLQQ
ncbi:hypothetical protein ACLBKS_03390 [Hylemonella sp. W303a]|uniref:hypothetical protein n=1 Tax=Hylemonella sp. W303a TaxID=3389873 RepID=UPI00396AFAB2